MRAYKGFNPDWTCKGMQYNIGNEYSFPEPAILCNKGFHACPNLLHTFDYYPPSRSIYGVVEVLGAVRSSKPQKFYEDTKIATNHIRIVSEMSLEDMTKAAYDYLYEKILAINEKEYDSNLIDKLDLNIIKSFGNINIKILNDYNIFENSSCFFEKFIVNDNNFIRACSQLYLIGHNYNTVTEGFKYGSIIVKNNNLLQAEHDNNIIFYDKCFMNMSNTNSLIGNSNNKIIAEDDNEIIMYCHNNITFGNYNYLVCTADNIIKGESSNLINGGCNNEIVLNNYNSIQGSRCNDLKINDFNTVNIEIDNIVNCNSHNQIVCKANNDVYCEDFNTILSMKNNIVVGEKENVIVGKGEFKSQEDSVLVGLSSDTIVSGGLGSLLVLVERDSKGKICDYACALVDGEKIKPDTWYCLRGGEIKEIKKCENILEKDIDIEE